MGLGFVGPGNRLFTREMFDEIDVARIFAEFHELIASLPPPNFVTVVKGTFRQDFTRTKHESFTRRNFDAAAI